MPCLPGFFPVMNDVQAGGVIGGKIDASFPQAPFLISAFRFGSSPSAAHGPIRSKVAASRPTMTILGDFTVWLDLLEACLTSAYPSLSLHRVAWEAQGRIVVDSARGHKPLRALLRCSASRNAHAQTSARSCEVFGQGRDLPARPKSPPPSSRPLHVRPGKLSPHAEESAPIA